MSGQVAVTPMRADLTCHATLAELAQAMDGSPLPHEAKG